MLTDKARDFFITSGLPGLSDSKADLFDALVADLYNKNRRFLCRKIKLHEVRTVLVDKTAIKGINSQDMISIAKALCKVASTVCPYVEKL